MPEMGFSRLKLRASLPHRRSPTQASKSDTVSRRSASGGIFDETHSLKIAGIVVALLVLGVVGAIASAFVGRQSIMDGFEINGMRIVRMAAL